jgi:2-polyprenyl-3-methyl-5-hydroxy-6-metoxy-1,4-benzoquinol methylase
MSIKSSWHTCNRRLSHFFTEKIGLAGNDHFIHSNIPYFHDRLREAIKKAAALFPARPLNVLDLGCGQHSYLEAISDIHPLIRVFGMDISGDEMQKNPFIVKKITHNSCSKNFADTLKEYQSFFHVIISHSFLEHVPDPDTTHSLVAFLLQPGGFAIHSYPTLYEPVLLAGYLIPEKITRKLLYAFEPFRADSGKFKTYYHGCRAFTPRMRNWYAGHGFDCIDFRNYFGTAYFYALFPVQWLLDLFYWMVWRLRLGVFSSLSIVTLRKK